MEDKVYLHTKPIVICGAGVAGLALGICLRKKGIPTLIIERDLGVTTQIKGEYFQPAIIPALKDLGVYEKFMKRGAVPIRRISHLYRSSIFNKLKRFLAPFENLSRGTHGLSLLHEDILEAFRERFREVGGDLQEGERVTALEFKSDGCDVALSESKIEASFFVGCDGKNSITRKMAGISLHEDKIHSETRVMVAALVEGLQVPRTEFLTAETPQGVLYAFHSNRGNVRVYLCITKSHYENIKSRLRDAFLEILQASDIPGKQNSNLVSSLLVMPSIDRLASSRIGLHSAWVGDAAGTVDPLCGHGMSLAISHALKLSDLLIEEHSRPTVKALEKYDRETLRDYLHTRFMGQWVGHLFMNTSRWSPLAKRRALYMYQRDGELLQYLIGLFAGTHKDSFGIYDLPYLLGVLPSKRRSQIKKFFLARMSEKLQNSLITTPVPVLKQRLRARIRMA